MSEITIKKENIEAAYKVASDETKEVLKALFAHENIFMNKPNLDDYKSIKTYEDACEALGEEPLPYEPNPTMTLYGVEYEVPAHIIALMKLETISRALWGREWNPEPDTNELKRFYIPTMNIYSASEIKRIPPKRRGSLLVMLGDNGDYFGCRCASNRTASAIAYGGVRLYQETYDKALYFGQQFIELWAKYLQFNFETGARLK